MVLVQCYVRVASIELPVEDLPQAAASYQVFPFLKTPITNTVSANGPIETESS